MPCPRPISVAYQIGRVAQQLQRSWWYRYPVQLSPGYLFYVSLPWSKILLFVGCVPFFANHLVFISQVNGFIFCPAYFSKSFVVKNLQLIKFLRYIFSCRTEVDGLSSDLRYHGHLSVFLH